MPRGWGFSSFFIGSVGQGFELSFARGGEFGHQKIALGFCRAGGWSGLGLFSLDLVCVECLLRHMQTLAQICPKLPKLA